MADLDLTDEWNRLIENLPETRDEILERIREMRENGDLEEASDILDFALRMRPLPELMREQGRTQLELEEYRRAISFLEPLTTDKDVDPEVLLELAEAHAKLGEDESAEEALERAGEEGLSDDRLEEARERLESVEVVEEEPEEELDDDEATVRMSDSWDTFVRATADVSAHGGEEAGDEEDPAEVEPQSAAEETPRDDEASGPRDEETADHSDEAPSFAEMAPDDKQAADERNKETADHSDEVPPVEEFDAPVDPQEESEPEDEQEEGRTTRRVDDGAIGDLRDSDVADAIVEGELAPTDSGAAESVGGEPSSEQSEVSPEPSEGPSTQSGGTLDAEAAGLDPPEDDRDATDADPVFPEIEEEKEEEPGSAEPPSLPEDSETSSEPAGPDQPTKKLARDTVEEEVTSEPPTEGSEPSPPQTGVPPAADDEERDDEPVDGLDAAESESPAAEDRGELPSPEHASPAAPDQTSFSWTTWMVVGATLGGLLGVASYMLYNTATSEVDHLESKLASAEESWSADSRTGWTEAFETLSRAAEKQNSGLLTSTASTLMAPLVTPDPASVRYRVRARRAFAGAMIEYRFEHCGSRDAESLLGRLGDSERSPISDAARIYRALACGELDRALKTSKKAIAAHPEHPDVLDARLTTLLKTSRVELLFKRVQLLESSADEIGTYRKHLLARTEAYRNLEAATDEIEALLDEYEGSYPEGRITRLGLLVDKGAHGDADELGRELLKASGSELSDYQKARVHNELGRAAVATAAVSEGMDQFDKATKLAPKRPEAYFPGIDAALATGDLERARQLVKRAKSRASPSPELALRDARVTFREGRDQKALETLGSSKAVESEAAVLRAEIALDRGLPDVASNHLANIHEQHPAASRARALSAVTELYMDGSDVAKAVEQLNQFSPPVLTDPVVARAVADGYVAAISSVAPKPARSYVRRGAEQFKALSETPATSLGALGRCRIRRIAGDYASARESCKRARERAPDSLDPRLASVRLEYAAENLPSGRKLLEELPDRWRGTWPASREAIRLDIRAGAFDAARKELSNWSGRAELPEHRFLKGLLAYRMGDYDSAAQGFGAIPAETSPSISGATGLFRAHALVRRGDFEEARTLLEKTTGLFRWRREALAVYGELLRREGEYWDALDKLRASDELSDLPTASSGVASHLYGEFALTWSRLNGWNHQRVQTNLWRARQQGNEDHSDFRFARALYLSNRSSPKAERAAEFLRGAIEHQPLRCELYRALREIVSQYELDEASSKVPNQTKDACG